MIAEILDRIKGRDVEDIIEDIEQANLNTHLEDEAKIQAIINQNN